MKNLFCIAAVVLLSACADNAGNEKPTETMAAQPDSNILTIETPETDPVIDNTKTDQQHQTMAEPVDSIPQNGTYRFEMSFAEKMGASMGEKVTVIIKDQTIKVVYEGDGNLKLPKGKVLEEGKIVKHKSGVWIITRNKEDAELDQIGGCSGGPAVIDFKNKKYLTC